MARIVQKFGGTSVADIQRIKNAAGRVKREIDAGNEVVVVVSAMAGTTNQLVDWTRQISSLHDAREYDVVVASGEQVTAGLMALALQDIGIDARSWLGWQVPHADRRRARQGAHRGDRHGRARAPPGRGQVAVVAGFQGDRPATAASRRSAAADRTPRRSRWQRC